MPVVKKIKGYIYDDGNNVSVEASVFDGESVIARSTFSLQRPNCQGHARQWLRKQGIPDELIEEQRRHNRDDQCKLDPETSLCSPVRRRAWPRLPILWRQRLSHPNPAARGTPDP